ncbi:hypothetical protein KVT40_003072 [Elsinoe batatas]|uniref:Uncharacterized protein n=1 Tax=Elsinoe batatas TaxID=2601811 RepID=A0A8K0PI57_9PEZI|nr:hypothetical protein KVT40_003072 [Elsinoe batatas]
MLQGRTAIMPELGRASSTRPGQQSRPYEDSPVDAVDPAGYARAVATQARRQLIVDPFSGELLRILSKRLDWEHDTTGGPALPVDVVLYMLSGNTERPHRILSNTQQLDDLDNYLDMASTTPASSQDQPKILLLQGDQPPQCLNRLGVKLKVDPRVYLRHLQYLWSNRPSKLFASPSLPSASADMVSLCVVTLGRHEPSNTPLRSLRQQAALDMQAYLHEAFMGRELKIGDSIVRGYWVHSQEYFSIEQEITVSLQYRNDQWSLLIWSDIARPLSSGPRGPWQHQRDPPKSLRGALLPSVRLSIARSTHRVPPGHEQTPMDKLGSSTMHALRSSLHYGNDLNPILMAIDPFYCLSDLFRTSAYSIDQLLKLVEGRIQENTGYRLSQSHHDSHEDLLYHQDILNKLRERTAQSLSDIRQYRHSWPKYTDQDQRYEVDRISDKLDKDFSNLETRIDRLLTRCREGMSMCMSIASIHGAEKARLQAERIGQLTWLAFFYTPLSFTTSFFGMNLADFGQKGGLPTWLWFAVSLPVVSVSYMALLLFAQYGRK